MISNLFLLQLLLTFITGSAWIFLTVYSGAQFGSKIGGFIGGLIITLTVLIAKMGRPFLGGIFAAFPAMFIATLTVTCRVQGIDFSFYIIHTL